MFFWSKGERSFIVGWVILYDGLPIASIDLTLKITDGAIQKKK